MADGLCHVAQADIGARLSGYHNVTSGSIPEAMMALYTQGPLAVAIDASHDSFGFFGEGVYYEPNCGNSSDALDHAVLAVGWGTDPQVCTGVGEGGEASEVHLCVCSYLLIFVLVVGW